MIYPEKTVLSWRLLVLPGIVMVAALTSLQDNLPGQSISALASQYASMLTPAGYSLVVVGLVFLSFLVYGVWQLQPSQREEEIYDRLSMPMVLSASIGVAWILCLRMNWMALSLVLAISLLYFGLRLYAEARNAVLKNEYSPWLSVPFSLYAGWLSVAVLINASFLFASLGWTSQPLARIILATVLMSIASMWAVWVGYRCGDLIFPSTVSWTCIGIFSAHGLENSFWGVVVLACAILPVIWMLITMLRRATYRHRIRSHKFSL